MGVDTGSFFSGLKCPSDSKSEDSVGVSDDSSDRAGEELRSFATSWRLPLSLSSDRSTSSSVGHCGSSFPITVRSSGFVSSTNQTSRCHAPNVFGTVDMEKVSQRN